MTWMFVYFSLYTVALRALKSILATQWSLFPLWFFPRRCYFWNFDRTVVLPKFWPDGIFTKIYSRAVFLSEFFPGRLFSSLPDGLFFTAWSIFIFTGSKLTAVWPVILTGWFNRLVTQKRVYFLAGQYYLPPWEIKSTLPSLLMVKCSLFYMGAYLRIIFLYTIAYYKWST